MTHRHDGDPDDDGLRSLRAVWLSLPDDDPPERGLAELMAAARIKADEMATPPWWQRIAQLLRRPPVLALASVTVLLGGAALLTKRGEDMHASAPAPRAEQFVPAAPAGREAEDRADPESVPAAEATAALTAEEREAEAASPRHPPAPRASRQEPHPRANPAKIAGDDASGADTTTGPLRADRDKAKDSLETDLRELAAPRTSSATSGPSTTSVPSATQLHRDARIAAARGDCDAVRTIAVRIANLDATYHRTKVAADPALAACLKR